MSKLLQDVETGQAAVDKSRNKGKCLLDADNDVEMYESISVPNSDVEDKREEIENRKSLKRKNNEERKVDSRRNTLQPKQEKNNAATSSQEPTSCMRNKAENENSFVETNELQNLENDEKKNSLTTVLYLQMKDAIRRLTEGDSSTNLDHSKAGCLFHQNGCKDFATPPEISSSGKQINSYTEHTQASSQMLKKNIEPLNYKVTKNQRTQLAEFSIASVKKLHVNEENEMNISKISHTANQNNESSRLLKSSTKLIGNQIKKGENYQVQLEVNGNTPILRKILKKKAEATSTKLNEIEFEKSVQNQPENTSLQMSDEALNVKLAAEALSLLRNNGRSICHEEEEYVDIGPHTSIQISDAITCKTSLTHLEKPKYVTKSIAIKPRVLFDATLEITDAVTGVKIPIESLHLDNNQFAGTEEKSDRCVTFRTLNGQKTDCIIPETLLHLSDTVTCIKVPLKAGPRCTVKFARSGEYDKSIQVSKAAGYANIPAKITAVSKRKEKTSTSTNASTDTSTSAKIPLEAVDLSNYFRKDLNDPLAFSRLLQNEVKPCDKADFSIVDSTQYNAKKNSKTECSRNSPSMDNEKKVKNVLEEVYLDKKRQEVIFQMPDHKKMFKTSKSSRCPMPKVESKRIGNFHVPPDDVEKVQLPEEVFMNKILLNANAQTKADVNRHIPTFPRKRMLNNSDSQKCESENSKKLQKIVDKDLKLHHGGLCEQSCHPSDSSNPANSSQQKNVIEKTETTDFHISSVIKSEPLSDEEESNIKSTSLDHPPTEAMESTEHPCVKTPPGTSHVSKNFKNGDHKRPTVQTSNNPKDGTAPQDTFSLLINDQMIVRILKYTNVKLALLSSKSKNRNCFKKPTTKNELKAFIGLLLISGALRQNTTNVPEIWSECFGAGIYRATFHEPRFIVLSKCICFGDNASGENCVDKDECPVGDIWEEYLNNCKTYSRPSKIKKTEKAPTTPTGKTSDDSSQLYSTARKTVNMPLRILFSMLDGAGVRGLAIFRRQNPSVKICQREYMKQVGMSLVRPHLQSRMEKPTLRRSIKELIESILNKKTEYANKSSIPPSVENALKKQKRCQLCPWNQDRKTKHQCVSCRRTMCRRHRSDMCVDCGENVG